ncbi:MAG: DNA alkylation repair protein [Candidatus Portnoybacteria bacterium]|jgi:3-methyladenine DNA glycosylase AlkD|nr:DNA alkylation repair protein [Candidatus Portnoybacteria bacterium]
MTVSEILKKLKALGDKKNITGMARFGIKGKKMLGVSMPKLRAFAKQIGKNHELALELWQSGFHEAKILASLVAEVEKTTPALMDKWIKDFDSWDVCDQTCMNLFSKTSVAYKKALVWSQRGREFEKRAGFALMACLGWYDKTASDKKLAQFFPAIKRAAADDRIYVRKAVNWALRQIGKRNKNLNKQAIGAAEKIKKIDSRSARWIAVDALRELQSEAVKKRICG